MKMRSIGMLFAFAITGHTLAMQMPIGQQNQQQSDRNQKQFQNQPYLTLAVIQPTPGYRTLEAHINDQQSVIRNAGYGLVPSKDWHLSVMVFAVPFPNQQPSDQYARAALNSLEGIITKYAPALTDVEFKYNKLETLGTHKFLAAEFERTGKKPFFRVYADIVQDFFQIYPNSWMYYGYGMVPHVSVASKMKAAGPAKATTIPGAPKQPVRNMLLRHKGRHLEISARWFDPNTQKLVEIKSNPI